MKLPIDEVLGDVRASLRRAPNLVLQAPTGAGKTTRVPPALLDLVPGQILMLEPRRIAARAAAARIAFERSSRLGDEIGYHVRFDRVAGPNTRLLVLTEGLLVRRLQDDPFLDGVDVVVVDEVHERSLQADLSLAMLRRVQRDVRPDLRIVAMSATLDADRLATFLDAPVITSEGRAFPVDVSYLPLPDARAVEVVVAAGVRRALASTEGDVLVFLPGQREIRATAGALADLDVDVVPLYGDLSSDAQDAALKAGIRRRVVLATNVAETSLTVPGVTAVVDSGLARVLRRDPATGLDRLDVERISRASAEQRRGRAGRVRAGVCLRLWTEREHRAMAERDDAEIHRVDLAGPALELACWGETDLAAFPWFEAPPGEALRDAAELLDRLDAVRGGVTPTGRAMARLPVHPRLSRMIVEGHRRGALVDAATIAAMLSERDVLPRDGPPAHRSESDVIDRLERLRRAAKDRSGPVLRVADRLVSAARDALGREGPGEDGALLRAIFSGWPDRVVRRRSDGERGVMVGLRGVRLRGSAVDAELFVAVDVQAADVDAIVRQASAVDVAWLDPKRVRTSVDLDFDGEKVVAVRRRRYDDLVLSEATSPLPDPSLVKDALVAAASTRLDRIVDEECAQWLARVRSLRAWRPDLGLPAFDEDDLRRALPFAADGHRSLGPLRSSLQAALQASLSWEQRQALDRDAPERITVPSGSAIRLVYEAGRPPILAVRIQELFGLGATPRVAGGRVPVLLHLLAPNGRPQQITDDLAGFWARTWPDVRKELRARYPRHAWPEDPRSEPPRRGPKRRT